MFDPNIPYNDLPPITTLYIDTAMGLAKLAEDTRVAIEILRYAVKTLPDPNTYGYQLGVKHQYKEGMFDQVDRVIYDLKNNPASRRILTNIYTFEDLHEMNLYPCAYSMTFNVSGNTLNGILNQRSQDMLTANNWNVVQYSMLLMMMAQVAGLEAGELVHVIADCHIYDRHIPAVEAMLEKEGFAAPKVTLDPTVTDFYQFTKDSFKVEDYQFHPFDFEIPMAI